MRMTVAPWIYPAYRKENHYICPLQMQMKIMNSSVNLTLFSLLHWGQTVYVFIMFIAQNAEKRHWMSENNINH